MATAGHLEAQEAELSVLGSILLDNGALDRVASVLSPEAFFAPRNQIIFRTMQRIGASGAPLDAVTLTTALHQSGELAEAGGADYLISLSRASATAFNIEHHAYIIHEQFQIRRLISVCATVVQKAQSGDYDDSARLFDEAQQAVFEVGQERQTKAFTALPEALAEAIERIKHACEVKDAITGLPTGYADLDKMTAGLQSSDLIILAARPAMGKTSLALNLAANGARLSGKTVAIFSLEMPTNQLAARLLSAEARIGIADMRKGMLHDGDIERLIQTNAKMMDWSIHIDDTPGITVMEVRAKCRQLASDRSIPDLGLIVIDYLQLMKGPPNIKSREQEISDISRNLKTLAKELDCPVMALSQLNRGLESRPDKRPKLSDLRESGAIEQDADIIMFVYRDEIYTKEECKEPGIAEIIIGKHRNGPNGTVKLRFFGKYTRFDNYEEQSQF